MIKRMQILVAIMVVCLMGASANADTIDTAAAGNWANTNTWGGGVLPGASDIAKILHAVTITNDAGTVVLISGNSNGSLTMNAGTLTVAGSGSNWNVVGIYSLSNSSTLTFNTLTRCGGTWVIDNSTLTVGGNFQVRTKNPSFYTFRNGATGTFADFQWYDVSASITSEGSLNTLTFDENLIQSADVTVADFVFVMDDTDAALSTFNFTTLDLTLAATWNLIVDVSSWNGVNGRFTLFDADTLTGAFDSVQFIGINAEDDAVTYDYDNGEITLDITPRGMVLVVK